MLLALLLACNTPSGSEDPKPPGLPGGPPVPEIPAEDSIARIKASGKLRVGTEAGYLPFEYRDKNGEFAGFDVDLARGMAQDLGVELELMNTAWDGIIPSLQTGRFDVIISGMTITPDRAEIIDFSEPYFRTGQSVLLAKKHAGTITSYKQLNAAGMIIATKLGTTGDFAASKELPQAEIRRFPTEAAAGGEVRFGKADAFVYDQPVITVFAARYPDAVVALPELFTSEDLGIGIRKGDAALKTYVDGYLAKIKADGTYEVLKNRYFVDTAWVSTLPE